MEDTQSALEGSNGSVIVPGGIGFCRILGGRRATAQPLPCSGMPGKDKNKSKLMNGQSCSFAPYRSYLVVTWLPSQYHQCLLHRGDSTLSLVSCQSSVGEKWMSALLYLPYSQVSAKIRYGCYIVESCARIRVETVLLVRSAMGSQLLLLPAFASILLPPYSNTSPS